MTIRKAHQTLLGGMIWRASKGVTTGQRSHNQQQEP